MKKKPNNTIVASFLMLLLIGCTKEKDTQNVSESIYGKYVYYVQWSLGGLRGPVPAANIKVKPLSGNYFTIIHESWSFLGDTSIKVLDSVVLGSNNAFSIDRYIPKNDTLPDTDSIYHITGSGNFSSKKVTYLFNIARKVNGYSNPLASAYDAIKVSDNYY